MATTTSFRLPDRPELGAAALAGGVVLGEVVLAAAIVQPRLLPLLALLALAIGATAVLRFPFATTLVFLALVASVLSPRVIEGGAGGVSLRGYEVVLAGLIGAALLAPRSRSWGGAAGAYAAMFLGVLAISSLAALSRGADFTELFAWSRSFGVLAIFFVVVRLFADARRRALLLAVAASIGAITGVIAVGFQFGLTASFLSADVADIFISEGQGSGNLDRIRLPGVALAYALFWYAAVRLLRTRGGTRFGWALVLLGCAMNLLMSFNRNMWAGVFVGLAALLLVGGTGLRRPIVGIVAIAGATVAITTLVGVEVGQGSPLQPIIKRGEVLLDPRAAQRDESLQARFDENRKALDTIEQNLIIGIGPGVPFGAYYDDETSSGTFKRSPQLFLHNQYLYLALIGGIPLFLAFVLHVVAALRAAWPARRDPETAAIGAGVLMIMLSGVVMISFGDSNMLATLAILTGTLVAGATERAAR